MWPVPLHMKLHCTGMEIPIFIYLCPNTRRTSSNKLYNKTIMQELEAFYFPHKEIKCGHPIYTNTMIDKCFKICDIRLRFIRGANHEISGWRNRQGRCCEI
jgi:hypothetical protein